jgi:hypothetical protein
MDYSKLTIPVSFYADVHDNIGQNCELSWLEFGWLLQSYSRDEFPNKESAPLFSPTRYSGTRDAQHGSTSALLVIDADHGWKIENVVAALKTDSIESIIYSTASNRDGSRFRVVVPLAEPIDLPTQRRAVGALRDYLADCLGLSATGVDQGKLSPVVLFYVPGKYAGATNEFCHVAGDVLAADQWIEVFPQPEPKKPEPRPASLNRNVEWNYEACEAVQAYRSRSNGRHAALYGMMCALVMSAENAGYDLSESELADIAAREQWGN